MINHLWLILFIKCNIKSKGLNLLQTSFTETSIVKAVVCFTFHDITTRLAVQTLEFPNYWSCMFAHHPWPRLQALEVVFCSCGHMGAELCSFGSLICLISCSASYREKEHQFWPALITSYTRLFQSSGKDLFVFKI